MLFDCSHLTKDSESGAVRLLQFGTLLFTMPIKDISIFLIHASLKHCHKGRVYLEMISRSLQYLFTFTRILNYISLKPSPPLCKYSSGVILQTTTSCKGQTAITKMLRKAWLFLECSADVQ